MKLQSVLAAGMVLTAFTSSALASLPQPSSHLVYTAVDGSCQLRLDDTQDGSRDYAISVLRPGSVVANEVFLTLAYDASTTFFSASATENTQQATLSLIYDSSDFSGKTLFSFTYTSGPTGTVVCQNLKLTDQAPPNP